MKKFNLGQHFLKNRGALKKIAAALDLWAGDFVIEIGAGHGELTEIMQNEKCKMKNGGGENVKCKIIAIEKDRRLVEILQKRFSQDKNVEIVEGDVLKVLPSIFHFPFFIFHFHKFAHKLVGNIPYYITGKLLRLLSELEKKPALCVFTLQREVAERICGSPPRMNRLAAITQFWAKPEILFYLPKNDFSPPPEVESAVIKLVTRIMGHGSRETEKYYRTVKVLFAQPRKTILNNLASGVGGQGSREEAAKKLTSAGINPQDRPQDLSVEEIKRIVDFFNL